MRINTIIALVVGVVCVVSAITTLFGAGSLIKVAYDELLGVPHNCYSYRPDGQCTEDKAQTKRDIADSAAMVTVAFPVAFFSFRRLTKQKEN